MSQRQAPQRVPLTERERQQLLWAYWSGTVLTTILGLLLFLGFHYLKGAFPDALPKWLWTLLKDIAFATPLWVLLAHGQGQHRARATGLSREGTLTEVWSRRPRGYQLPRRVAVGREYSAVGKGGLLLLSLFGLCFGSFAAWFLWPRAHTLATMAFVIFSCGLIALVGLAGIAYFFRLREPRLLLGLSDEGLVGELVLAWEQVVRVEVTCEFDYLGRETKLGLLFTDSQGGLHPVSLSTSQQQKEEPTTSLQLQTFYVALRAAFEQHENQGT
ncbi:hypothetical protein [Armatimonas rosea]|uniref:Uncharacterized protein n=1 Tax=Armatimonas rosea TaxID=685828 RepID=A0A7W9SPD0_ARMRO|nr:hypothetical protein [Armatimonas rosea]MBB6050321.1 hypothetical protein [Armatimonas rosea]